MNNVVKFSNGELAWEARDYAQHQDDTGALGVVEYGRDFDFEVKRAFFVDTVKAGSIRGKHSHQELKQLVLCLKGSFLLELDTGSEKCFFALSSDRATCVYVDGRVWREMSDFSEDALMLVLCDREYKNDRVIRDYEQFLGNLNSCK